MNHNEKLKELYKSSLDYESDQLVSHDIKSRILDLNLHLQSTFSYTISLVSLKSTQTGKQYCPVYR